MKTSTLNKILLLIIIILVALLVAPYFVTRTSAPAPSDMSSTMIMKSFDLTASTSSIPTVSFEIKKDTLDGWDLHVVTTNYTWTPELINQAPIANEGHAHLYIDGNLIVLLAPWYHIPSSVMGVGKHTITVSLNANDHSVFTDNGKNIQITQTFYVNSI